MCFARHNASGIEVIVYRSQSIVSNVLYKKMCYTGYLSDSKFFWHTVMPQLSAPLPTPIEAPTLQSSETSNNSKSWSCKFI